MSGPVRYEGLDTSRSPGIAQIHHPSDVFRHVLTPVDVLKAHGGCFWVLLPVELLELGQEIGHSHVGCEELGLNAIVVLVLPNTKDLSARLVGKHGAKRCRRRWEASGSVSPSATW